jgi:hypothetical protein
MDLIFRSTKRWGGHRCASAGQRDAEVLLSARVGVARAQVFAGETS